MQPFDGKIEIPLTCKHCGAITYVTVDRLAYNQWWWKGTGAREFFPELSDNIIKLMISGKCWNCASDESGAK